MKIEWKTCFRLGVSIFALYLCIHYWSAVQRLLGLLIGSALPIIIGCAIAFVTNILMSFYEKHYFPKSKKKLVGSSRRPVCITAAFLTVLLIVVLVVSLIVPQLVSCVKLIVAELPDAIRFVIKKVEAWGIVPENIIHVLSDIDWQSRIGSIIEAFTSGVGNVMDIVFSAVTSVFSGIVTGFLSIIFAVYILASKERLASQFNKLGEKYVSEKFLTKSTHVISTLNTAFRNYIVGQCTEAVILGALCTLGMLIFRLPYAAMIGALIAFTALIPVAGAYIGAIVGAFMILTVSPVKALIFLVFIIVLQQLEGNIVYPKVVGSSIGLPAIWVLAAVTIGGGMFGVVGMLIAVPIAAALYKLLRDDVNKA